MQFPLKNEIVHELFKTMHYWISKNYTTIYISNIWVDSY